MISHSSKTASEVSNVLDKFLNLGLERYLSRVEPWPHLHWIRARFWEIIFVDLHQFVTPALGVWHLFSLRGGNPHKYIHTQYTWTKKMNAKIFFVHRSKYHKSDYKFHHTDSYKHSRYLSCGLSCLGHSQVAENIRCLILIFWENNFVTGKPLTDRVTTLPPHCSICLVSCLIGRCLWWLEKQFHHGSEWSLYQGLSGEDLQCGSWIPPWSS